MNMGRTHVIATDPRSEFRRWQNDYALQLQEMAPRIEAMRQKVEGLRDLMVPLDCKFAAAVKALTETTMQLYLIVNDRSPPVADEAGRGVDRKDP